MKHLITNKLQAYYFPLIGVPIYLILQIMFILIFGTSSITIFTATIFIFIGLILFGSFFKTKNFPSLIIGIMLMGYGVIPIQPLPFFILFIIPPVLATISAKIPWISAYGSWDIFYPFNNSPIEMAARNVDSVLNGYTDRPYPFSLEKLNFTTNEIIEFGKFLQKNLVALLSVEEEKIVLVFDKGVLGYIPFIRNNRKNATYVTIFYSGDISIHISKKEYQRYNHPLTFDQLCNSFGNVLIHLFELYRKGEGSHIIHLLKQYALLPSHFYNDTFLDFQSIPATKE